MTDRQEKKQEATRNKVEQKFDGDAVTKGNMDSHKLTETYSEKQKAQREHEEKRNHPAAGTPEPDGPVSETRNSRRSEMERKTEEREGGRIAARNTSQKTLHDELSDERETDL